ncbi:hypothetical protein [Colwellia psychrerythraea]|uniref:Uncharacterized protein n=1 Tax=Colwellia psychrerythraea TaxID=28229 RepID=A0A099L3Z8_COLPS|nr:hypothetical protein [Colwellia psychrerythraea]KGJ97581.1 hypothetical protein GAB14E_1170 [Colwellia psychrerythraea]
MNNIIIHRNASGVTTQITPDNEVVKVNSDGVTTGTIQPYGLGKQVDLRSLGLRQMSAKSYRNFYDMAGGVLNKIYTLVNTDCSAEALTSLLWLGAAPEVVAECYAFHSNRQYTQGAVYGFNSPSCYYTLAGAPFTKSQVIHILDCIESGREYEHLFHENLTRGVINNFVSMVEKHSGFRPLSHLLNWSPAGYVMPMPTYDEAFPQAVA